jgi:pimeloyl-ACP methyl ester carboxylesterase
MSIARPDGESGWIRTLARTALALIAFLVLAALAGATYNIWAIHHYRALYPVPGRFYRVNGHSMHLYCLGEGSPTVVLESGGDYGWIWWAKVQTELSKTTRVCSYDRAGYGWSEPQPGPRDSNSIADQLHTLLTEAGVDGPMVLMGHSAAGRHMRAYVTRYPQNIVGLVFVDASTPLQEKRFPKQPETPKTLFSNPFSPMLLLRLKTTFGMQRVEHQCAWIPSGFEPYAGWIKADSCIPSEITEAEREESANLLSGEETVHTGPFGNLPILIFSDDVQQPRSLVAIWNSMQEDLKRLSTRSRRIIVRGSAHNIEIDHPDLLSAETKLFIEQIRRTAPQPTDYGSTKTE